MAGPVLLAINPFKDALISGSDVITAYREKILDSPHVYVIADTAYNDMMRGELHKFINHNNWLYDDYNFKQQKHIQTPSPAADYQFLLFI